MKQLSLLALGLPVALFVGNSSGQTWPAEWLDAPFGTYSTNYPGGSAYDESTGTFTLSGSGTDMYSAANDGARFVFIPVRGDCEVFAVVGQPTDPNLSRNARAGVMLREHNARGSRHAIIAHMRGTLGTEPNRLTASGRLTLDATGVSLSRNNIASDPQAFHLIRQGDVCRCYYNSNGVWTVLNTLTVAMGEDLNAGVFVTSGNAANGPVLTNAFAQVFARPLVSVQTNAAAGFDVAWAADLPALSQGWAYTYTLSRQAEGGPVTTQALGLASAAFTDADIAPGVWYRYTAAAVPVPQEGLASPPVVHLGTSAPHRIPRTSTNLVSGLPQGWFAAYHSPTGAIPPILTRTEDHLTNAAAATVAGTDVNYRAVLNASLTVDSADTYTFLADSDDGVRLSVGGRELLNNWYGGRSLSQSGPVYLEAGRAYPVRLEYLQNTGGRALALQWRRAGAPDATEDVPPSAFSPVPLPWTHEDIGDTTLHGNAAFDTGTGAVAVTSAGNALTEAADAAHLVSRDVSGDFDLTARLDSLTGESPGRRAGLAVRAGRAPGAPAFTLLAAPDGGGTYTLLLAARTAADAAPAVANAPTAVPLASPLWLRLSRKGPVLAALWRADGDAAWTPLGTYPAPLALSGTYTAGLLASSADAATAASAVFGAVLTDTFPATASLLPTHDAYVQFGTPNKGAENSIALKREGGTTQREGFLRFNVAGLSAIRSAVLRLYVAATPIADAPLGIRAFTDLEWDELTATWDNPPGGLPMPTVFLAGDDPALVFSGTTPAQGGYLEVDATDIVRQAAAGCGDVTFDLFARFVNANTLTFGSKERTDAAQRPALILTFDAPFGVAADGGPDAGGTTVSWSAYGGATAYRVYRAAAAEGPFAQTGGDVTGLTFKDTGLTAGTRYWYAVAAVTPAGETAPSSAVWADAPAAVTALIADEDTYVNGTSSEGDLADRNYGNAAALTIKYNAGSQYYHREAYLRFDDIAGLGQAERVVLRVVPTTSSPGDPATIPVQVFLMPSNDWSESVVTFNNPPPGVTPPTPRLADDPKRRVTVFAEPVGQAMAFDVTEIVREAARANADNRLSLGLIRIDNAGSFNLSIASSEHGTASYHPRLIATFGRTQPPAVTATNGYVTLAWLPYRGAVNYTVRRAEAPGGPFTALTTTAATAFADLAANDGKIYWYTLAAVTPEGEREASRPVPARVLVFEARAPLADAGIDSNSKGSVSGLNATMSVKYNPAREVFYKFDVSDLAEVASARLRVNIAANPATFGPVNYIVRVGDFGDWNERGLCYDNPPPGYTPPSLSTAAKGSNELARVRYEYKDPGNQNNNIEADVTEAVRQAARAGKPFLTLFVTGDSTLQHSEVVGAAGAKEHGTAARRPALLIGGTRFGAPQTLRAEPLADGFTLTWRPVAGAVRYIVARSAPPDYAAVTVADDVTDTSFTDTDPAFWNDRDYTYTVTAVHGDGTRSEAAVVTRPLTRTFAAPALADTYVRGGTYTNQNNALSASLEIKGDANIEYQREGFIRLDTAGLPDSLVDAKLRLTLRSVNAAQPPDYEVVLFETADTGWAESGGTAPTWNSVLGEGALHTPVPPAGDPSVIARFNLLASGWQPGEARFFDITPFVKAAKARAAQTLMVQLIVANRGGSNNFLLHSLQAASLADIPSVVYTVARRPAPATLLWLK
jgi:fibronectin type 3 domain-containing protein